MAKAIDLHLLKHKEEVLREDNQPRLEENKYNQEPLAQQAPPDQQAEQELSRLSQKSAKILVQIHTVFPFDFFPDILTVDAVKINYKKNILFSSGYMESIAISDITNVTIESAVLFSTLTLFFSVPTREIHIKPFWKNDAEKARNIIAGLILTTKQHIDINFTQAEKETIEKVGATHT